MLMKNLEWFVRRTGFDLMFIISSFYSTRMTNSLFLSTARQKQAIKKVKSSSQIIYDDEDEIYFSSLFAQAGSDFDARNRELNIA